MDTLKTVAITIVVATVVAGGFAFFFPKQTSQIVGSVASPDIQSPWIRFGGVTTYGAHTEALNSATTTPLAIQSPTATSTLQLGSGCHLSVSSTTAKAVRFAKATSPNATTTFLFGANAAANAKLDVAATTTDDNYVFAPNNWLVMSMVGGTGVDSPSGSCSARFVVL